MWLKKYIEMDREYSEGSKLARPFGLNAWAICVFLYSEMFAIHTRGMKLTDTPRSITTPLSFVNDNCRLFLRLLWTEYNCAAVLTADILL